MRGGRALLLLRAGAAGGAMLLHAQRVRGQVPVLLPPALLAWTGGGRPVVMVTAGGCGLCAILQISGGSGWNNGNNVVVMHRKFFFKKKGELKAPVSQLLSLAFQF